MKMCANKGKNSKQKIHVNTFDQKRVVTHSFFFINQKRETKAKNDHFKTTCREKNW